MSPQSVVPFEVACRLCGASPYKALLRGHFFTMRCDDVAACAVRQARFPTTPLPGPFEEILYRVHVDAGVRAFAVVGGGHDPATFHVHFLEPVDAVDLGNVELVLLDEMPATVAVKVTSRPGAPR